MHEVGLMREAPGLCALRGTAFPLADAAGRPRCRGATLPDSSGADLVPIGIDVSGEEGRPCAEPYRPV